MWRLVRVAVWAVVVVSLGGLAGCGAPVGQVSGKITNKGEPVAGAEFMFASVADPGSQFFGLSVEGGNLAMTYRELKGLPVGKYTVSITQIAQQDGKALPGGEEGRILKSSAKTTKKVYVFDADIAEGGNTLTFELTQAKEVRSE